MSQIQPPSSRATRAGNSAQQPLARLLALGRPVVMGVLNVTPDSFSDGGRFFDPERAIDHARALVAEGADILDIGAESTRPYGGQVAVSAEEELRRLEPILPTVLALGIPVSIDTMKATVAAWALDAGAVIANDVWGLQRDGDMARVVAERGVPVIVMHNREAADPTLDIMADIATFFSRSLAIAERAGAASLDDLRNLPVETLVTIAFHPQFNIDGHALTRSPYDAYAAKAQNNVDLLVGANADEGQWFLQNAEVTVENFYEVLTRTFPGWLVSVIGAKPGASDSEARAGAMLADVYSGGAVTMLEHDTEYRAHLVGVMAKRAVAACAG